MSTTRSAQNNFNRNGNIIILNYNNNLIEKKVINLINLWIFWNLIRRVNIILWILKEKKM